MAKMQAIRCYKPNFDAPAEAAQLEQLSVPEPQHGQVLVKLLLRPVNPADCFTLQGVYPGAAAVETWPMTPGLDGYGVIAKLGPGASMFSEGQRVAIAGFPAKVGNGSWQEYAAYSEADLIAVPDSVDDETAAQFFVNPVTVYGMLQALKLQKGDWVAFSAAGSAISRMGIHLAKHYGLKTIGIVRRDEHREEVVQAGADVAISSASEDVAARMKEVTGGKGADGALDSVAGKTLGQLVDGVKDGGTTILYGAMSGFTAEAGIVPLIFRGATITGFWLSPYIERMTAEEKAAVCSDVMSLLEQKVMQPSSYVGQLFKLSEVKAAVQESVKTARGGKVFLDSR